MIVLLRLGHRCARDKRVTTHCGLVARAFGADKMIFCGEKDDNIAESVKKVSEKWGGNFSAQHSSSWKTAIKNFEGLKVHLTFYGMPVRPAVEEIKAEQAKSGRKNLMVIIGAEKVPSDVYLLADYNVCVGSQPHSEIAALAVFLHEYFSGKELERDFQGELTIIPQRRGKKILEKQNAQ